MTRTGILLLLYLITIGTQHRTPRLPERRLVTTTTIIHIY